MCSTSSSKPTESIGNLEGSLFCRGYATRMRLIFKHTWKILMAE